MVDDLRVAPGAAVTFHRDPAGVLTTSKADDGAPRSTRLVRTGSWGKEGWTA
jgi:hypothetical protein